MMSYFYKQTKHTLASPFGVWKACIASWGLTLLLLLFAYGQARAQNNALNFDGSNDVVNCGNTTSLHIFTGTIEAWIRTSNPGSSYRGIVVKENAYGIFLRGNELIAFDWTGGGEFTSGRLLNDGNWHHVAFSFQDNITNGSRLYVDGVLVGTKTYSINNQLTSLAIGNNGGNTQNINATIDEVRVWNIARTCDQIQSTMNRELVGNEAGLVAYYNFNQGTAGGTNTGLTTLNDLAGTAENGTLTNFALTTGTTSNWVDGAGNGVTGTTPQTPAEINVTVGASGSTRDVGGYTTGTPVDFTYTIQNTGNMSLSLTNSPRVTVTGGSGFAVLTQPSASTVASGGSLTFVVRFTPAVTGTTYTTAFRISNSDCDESDYTFTLTGKAINATTSGVRGNMMNFDEVTNKHIAIPHNASLNIGTGQLTLSAWVRRSSAGTFDNILMKGAYGYGFVIDDNNRLGYWSEFNYNNCFNSGSNTIPAGVWAHVAVVVNAGTSTTLYINGVNVGTSANAAHTVIINNTSALGIGTQDITSCNCNNFDGNIEEVQIWNTARTQTQIRENMHLTLAGVETGLVGYWQFNEASGNAIDAVAGNNGTLQNGVSRTTSTVSVGRGVSKTTSVTSIVAGAEVSLATTNMEIDFSTGSANPNGEIVISQISGETPFQNTTTPNATTSCYWVVRNFGTNTGLAFDNMRFQIPNSNVILAADETLPTNLKLYRRNVNAGGTWTQIASGSSASNTTKLINFTSPTNTSFSEFVIGSTSGALPITLTRFAGERVNGGTGFAGGQVNGGTREPTEEVRLTWETASEINNKGFEVEMSENGLTYEKIAFVEGKGNHTTIQPYSHTTLQPYGSYYRLRQVDFDGSFSYSPVVFVEGMAGKVVVYPNPSKGTFTINVGKDKLDLPARLFNAQGIESSLISEGGMYKVSNNLPAGVYFLHTVMAGKAKVTKVIIQH